MPDEKSGLNAQQRSEHYGSVKSTTKCESVQLSWNGVRVVHRKSGRVILDEVCGQAEAGELVALMGSSGAGKSTLLNTLLARNLKDLDVNCNVLVNGTRIRGQIAEISGYVQQDDLFVSTLTVAEHLTIQADLRLVDMSRTERRRRVNEVIQKLGLSKCRNTRIGKTEGRKGISGGETKRLMFASELLDNPPLLFCDEPTTGLDSAKAESVVNVMRSLTESGHTIICTIHQPSSAIFRKFDKVIFLANGRLAYFGSPAASVRAFAALGYPCPRNYNPADSIIETLSVESNQEQRSRARIDEVCQKFAQTEDGRQLVDRVERTRSESLTREPSIVKRRMASFPLQVWSLLQRSMLDNYRNPALARAKFIQKVFMGVFVGLLYLQTPLNWVGISNLNGAIFYLVQELTYSTLFGILSFLPAEYPLLVREYHDGLYYLFSYYVARGLSYVPLFSLDGAVMITIAYWMVGLAPTFSRFLIAIGIGILAEQSAAAFGVMLASCAPSYPVAISIAGPLLSILSLTGGLYANIGELPAWISWFQYLSWFRYGFEALAINQWVEVENNSGNHCLIPIDATNSTGGCLKADDVFRQFSFSRSNFVLDISVMASFIVIFYFIGFVGLLLRVRLSR